MQALFYLVFLSTEGNHSCLSMLILRWGFRASNQLEDDSNVYLYVIVICKSSLTLAIRSSCCCQLNLAVINELYSKLKVIDFGLCPPALWYNIHDIGDFFPLFPVLSPLPRPCLYPHWGWGSPASTFLDTTTGLPWSG